SRVMREKHGRSTRTQSSNRTVDPSADREVERSKVVDPRWGVDEEPDPILPVQAVVACEAWSVVAGGLWLVAPDQQLQGGRELRDQSALWVASGHRGHEIAYVRDPGGRVQGDARVGSERGGARSGRGAGV